MIAALVLLAQIERATPVLARTPEGWTTYQTEVAGYNAMFAYAYKRKVIVLLGPQEPTSPTATPAEPVDIRYAIVGVQQIVSVPKGEVCNPGAPVYIEIGEELFHNCRPEPQP